MSNDKAILHGKETRKPYRGAKAVDTTCRNHGGCPHCARDRTHKHKRREPADEQEIDQLTGNSRLQRREVSERVKGLRNGN